MSEYDPLRCLFCGEPCYPEDVADWEETVNLTPDLVVFGQSFFPLIEQLPTVGEEDGYNFCRLECFARWCWNHAREDATARQLVGAAS